MPETETTRERSWAAKTAYPPALREAELQRWRLGLGRRFGLKADGTANVPESSRTPQVGVALSGGGIRSATFSLGAFQAFARAGFLKHISFLSTISGGGYFGSFLGALFSRDYIRSPDDVASVLLQSTVDQPDDPPTLVKARSNVIPWLRENGRYLSPRGAGDQLLFFAVLFRNWFALNVVIALPLITTALIMQLPRFSEWFDSNLGLPSSGALWWSPWVATAILPLALVPSAIWAYFIRDGRGKLADYSLLTTTLVAAVVIAGSLSSSFIPGSWFVPTPTVVRIAIGMFAAAQLTLLFLIASDAEDPSVAANILAQWLRAFLFAAAVLFAAGFFDSLGQSVYFKLKAGSLFTWVTTTVGAAIAGVAAFARQIAVLIGSKTGGDRPKLPFAILGNVAAISLVLILGTGYSAAAHAIAWDFRKPAWPAGESEPAGVVKVEAPADVRFAVVAQPEPKKSSEGATREAEDGLRVIGWILSAAALTWGFGQKWRFVNYSTQQPLYSARLARAYLGASNPKRWAETAKVPVIEPIKGDDATMSAYWPGLEAPEAEKYSRGAPLHFVGLTINATMGSRSQVEQRDRKGIGLAVGPAGLSAGVRHHAVFADFPSTPKSDDPEAKEKSAADKTKEETSTLARKLKHISPEDQLPAEFNALDYGQQKAEVEFRGEQLKLSMWTGLSGAAFSTGLGARTNIGLSLLTGFMNIRLGYWWEANPDHHQVAAKSASLLRRAKGRFGGRLQYYLPVHRYLADEFMSRFPGVSRNRWYLSDGGHFENLGGYELLRRRVPLAIMIDAGEDGNAMFEDLGNLVRKARTDFDAEIVFADGAQLEGVRKTLSKDGSEGSGTGSVLGTLDSLRPDCDDVPDCESEAGTERPYTRAFAALGTVTYDISDVSHSDKDRTILLYVKPGLTRDLPADLINYGRLHPDFPHQSTADQFFDEAQWESYRKLGESIISRVVTELRLQDPQALIDACKELKS